jgi:hypothetical protein
MAISERLQKRIQNLTGDMMESPSANLPDLLVDPNTGKPKEPVGADNLPDLIVNPNTGEPKEPVGALPLGSDMPEMMPELSPEKMEILEGIEEMQRQLMQTTDPEEALALSRLIEAAKAKVNAPLGDLAAQLASQGTGEDKLLIHAKPNEVVLPEEFFEDEEFEGVVERKFREFGINPERAIVGSGIASLNATTGLEEFGFFKKVFKSVKKVVKKVAPVAAFVPGVGTALGGVLGGIGSIATKIPVIGGALGTVGSTVAGGIANLGIPGISSIAGGTTGGFGGIADALTTKSGLLGGGMFGETGSTYLGGPEAGKGLANRFGLGSGTAAQVAAYQAQTTLANLTPAQRAVMDPVKLQNLENLAAGGRRTGFLSNLANIFGGGQQQQLYDAQGNPVNRRGGFGGGFGNIAKTGLLGLGAYKLGKLAFDEAKDAKGVPLVPLTTMDAAGRYDIEAEIARRMGQPAPNPVEFGLLPAGTIPTLSGGMAQGGAVMPMAYAEGGGVAMEDFQRMNGEIDGPGTETSDDIPAMLSDGEFVMTGRAVRGAGAFDMQNDGGIITLRPNGAEDRDRGTNLMYEMMSLFESQGAS